MGPIKVRRTLQAGLMRPVRGDISVLHFLLVDRLLFSWDCSQSRVFLNLNSEIHDMADSPCLQGPIHELFPLTIRRHLHVFTARCVRVSSLGVNCLPDRPGTE